MYSKNPQYLEQVLLLWKFYHLSPNYEAQRVNPHNFLRHKIATYLPLPVPFFGQLLQLHLQIPSVCKHRVPCGTTTNDVFGRWLLQIASQTTFAGPDWILHFWHLAPFGDVLHLSGNPGPILVEWCFHLDGVLTRLLLPSHQSMVPVWGQATLECFSWSCNPFDCATTVHLQHQNQVANPSNLWIGNPWFYTTILVAFGPIHAH